MGRLAIAAQRDFFELKQFIGQMPKPRQFAKFFDQRDAFAKKPRGVRSANANRATTNYYKVEVLNHAHAPRGNS